MTVNNIFTIKHLSDARLQVLQKKQSWLYDQLPCNLSLIQNEEWWSKERELCGMFGWTENELSAAKKSRHHFLGIRHGLNCFLRLAVLFLFSACTASRPVIVIEKPKVAVVPVSEQASPWQTLAEVEAMRPYAYFYYPRALNYKVAYLTPVGKIPFLEKEIPLDGIFDFWPSVLTEFNYEENPSKLVYVTKDVVYATPCYVKVQAWNGIKWSAWSDSVLVR